MRVDGPPARGLWPPNGGRLCRKVMKEKVLRIDRPDGRRVLKFDGATPRGLWIALRAMLMKSALRDWLFASYGMIGTTVISHLRWLPPFGALRHHLPPAERWDNKAPRSSPFISSSQHNGALKCPRLRGWQRNWIHRGAPRPANPVTCFPPGKVVAPAIKGGMHFLARRAVVKVLS